MSGDQLDLDAIEARAQEFTENPLLYVGDVDETLALVAEVRRLRALADHLARGPVGTNYASSGRRPPRPFENTAG